MSLSLQKKAQISEPLPCPECGEETMKHTVEDCPIEGKLTVKQLSHFKCQACGARFFDTEAVHRIQEERKKYEVA